MKHAFALAVTSALALSVVTHEAAAAAQNKPASQKPTATTGAKAAEAPPITVEVVAVDPDAKTITIREIAVVPAAPGKAVEVKLPVPADATGEKLGDVKVGEKVDVTCSVKPTVHPTAGVPALLTDCAKVIKIEPKS
jgi:protein-disulfide isomerase